MEVLLERLIVTYCHDGGSINNEESGRRYYNRASINSTQKHAHLKHETGKHAHQEVQMYFMKLISIKRIDPYLNYKLYLTEYLS